MYRKSPTRVQRPVTGFTLIELLVVITIIVVLLAMLTPALDRAIYYADLTSCAARQHAIAIGSMAYASDAKRFYPYRALTARGTTRPIDIQYYWPSALPMRVDDRPVLRSFLGLNASLNCPLAPQKLDYEGAGGNCNVIADYGLWFSFGFPGEQAMRKMGDRFTYGDDSFDLLTGDWSGIFVNSNETAPHNDADQSMGPFVRDETEYYTNVRTQASYANYSLSSWTSATYTNGRGPLDLSFTFADGSAVTYNRVTWNEGDPAADHQRIVQIPQWDPPSNQAIALVQVPRR